MAKVILYHANYDGSNGNIYGVYRDAIFDERSVAYEAMEALQNREDEEQRRDPIRIKARYKIAEAWKAGGWKAQRLALQDMLQNGGL